MSDNNVVDEMLNGNTPIASTNIDSMKMRGDRALLIAAGRKELFFSAVNSSVHFREGRKIEEIDGVNFVNPAIDSNGHYLDIKVLHPYLNNESFEAPAYEEEEDNIDAHLPMIIRCREKKNICDLTEDEAKQAGFTKVIAMKIALALQSNESEAMENQIKAIMFPALKAKKLDMSQPNTFTTENGEEKTITMSEEKIDAFLGQTVSEVLKLLRRDGDPNQIASPEARDTVKQVIRDVFSKIDPQQIPGEVAIYSTRLATPEEMVSIGGFENAETAKKSLAESLRYFPALLRHDLPKPDKLNLCQHLYLNFTRRGVNDVLDNIERKADELDPPARRSATASITDLEELIALAHKKGKIADKERADMLFDLAKGGKDPKAAIEIAGLLHEKLESQQQTRSA